MSERPKLENLNVLNNFLINAIANDPDVGEAFFQLMLSILLDMKIGRVSVRAQPFLPGNIPGLRGIQLDVEVTEYLDENPKGANCRLFNVEPQLYKDNLPKRSRFYQAKKDSKGLRAGEKNWNKLPDLFMIFITNYDPFGRDSMVYTFDNTCKEFPDLEYKDGLKFIYFNTTGNLNATKAKKELLNYLNDSKIERVTNENIAQLHNYVSSVRDSAEVQSDYMTLGEWIDWNVEELTEARVKARLAEELERGMAEGRERGMAEGRERGMTEGRERGMTEGRVGVLVDTLSDLGVVPDEILERIQDLDADTLKQWTKLAARADSMEEFLEKLGGFAQK